MSKFPTETTISKFHKKIKKLELLSKSSEKGEKLPESGWTIDIHGESHRNRQINCFQCFELIEIADFLPSVEEGILDISFRKLSISSSFYCNFLCFY